MCGSASEVSELFTAKKVPISASEIEKLLIMTSSQEQSELDADQLDIVSGGATSKASLLLLPFFRRLPITLPVANYVAGCANYYNNQVISFIVFNG